MVSQMRKSDAIVTLFTRDRIRFALPPTIGYGADIGTASSIQSSALVCSVFCLIDAPLSIWAMTPSLKQFSFRLLHSAADKPCI